MTTRRNANTVDRNTERRVSRRDALKVLAPAGIAVASGWLVGCGEEGTEGMLPLDNRGISPAGGANAGAGGVSDGNAPTGTMTQPATDAAGMPVDNPPGAKPGSGMNDPSTAGGGPPGDGMNAQPSDGANTEPGDGMGAQPSDDPNAEPADGMDPSPGDDMNMPPGDDTVADPVDDVDLDSVPWASGGTAAMDGNYPDPFATATAGMACALYPAQTIGPCYASPVMQRQDISEGMAGLPLRLSFLVVRRDGCTPVPDAEVDVWHAGSNGAYSNLPGNFICNPEFLPVDTQSFGRGRFNTDAQGRVDFDTIFPGWYTGRTIHIHFTVRVGGVEYATSQLYFDDELNDEITGTHVDYRGRGMRDTTNASDWIMGGARDAVLMSHTKRPDGALHAWKILSIRS